MKTGTIKEITPTGTWKELFKFDYEMEGGEKGGALHKTKDSPYHVGQVINYEVSVNEKGYSNIKFENEKPAYTNKSGYNQKDPVEEAKRQLSINRQSSVKCATELVCNGKADFDDLLLLAQRITDWTTGDQVATKMKSTTDSMPF